MTNQGYDPPEKPAGQTHARSSPLRGYERERGVNRDTPPLRGDEPRGGTDKQFTPRSRWENKMNDKIKAKYLINFYELDSPIAVNITGTWSAIVRNGVIMMNTNDDASTLLRATVLEISHPKLGNIRGLDTEGLDYTIALENGNILKLEAEETPGLLYDCNEKLDPPVLDVLLWNPVITEIPFSHAFAGITHEEQRMIWNRRIAEVRQKMGKDSQPNSLTPTGR
jgi:hypothetical protein